MPEDKIKNYINENFKPIYAISTLYKIYLIGGALQDIILNREPRDLDFVLLSNNEKEADDYIKAFLNKFKFDYKINKLNGYKIHYKNKEIDLWHTKDLFDSFEYNADGLLYDIENNQLISISFNDFLKSGVKKINNENNLEQKSNKRLLKLQNNLKEFKKIGW